MPEIKEPNETEWERLLEKNGRHRNRRRSPDCHRLMEIRDGKRPWCDRRFPKKRVDRDHKVRGRRLRRPLVRSERSTNTATTDAAAATPTPTATTDTGVQPHHVHGNSPSGTHPRESTTNLPEEKRQDAVPRGSARKQMPPPPARIQSEQPTPTPSDSSPVRQNRKRKGKKPLPGDPYAIKRQLSDEVAQKIASTPSVEMHTPTQNPNPSSGTTQKPDTPPRPPKTASPTTSVANTNPSGIVVHGVALRKDLSKVRKWLEADNKDLGKTVGIRWLKKKTLLVDEDKKTSSVVVYLENTFEGGRVRLGGRWLRTDQYERDRGRK